MKITFDLSINSDKTIDRIFDKQTMLATQTEYYRLVTPYTPFRTGNLYKNVDIDADGVIYKSPYAQEVYFNRKKVNFSKDLHPLATARWGEVAMISKKDDLINFIEEYLKRK